MNDFWINNKLLFTLLLLALLSICTTDIQSQSLIDIINQAKDYVSEDPAVSDKTNREQQIQNLYDIIPIIENSEHEDTLGLVYYYLTYRHHLLNNVQEVKKNANLSLKHLQQSNYNDYIIPFSYFYRAQANKLLGYSEEAINDIKSIFSLTLKGRSLNIISDAQRLMASIYHDRGDHESAISQLNYFLNSPIADSLDAYSKATLFSELSISYSSYSDSLSIQKATQAIEESYSYIPSIAYEYERIEVGVSTGMQMAYMHNVKKNISSAITIYNNILPIAANYKTDLDFKRYYVTALANLIELNGEIKANDVIEKLLKEHKGILQENIDLELQDSYALLFENISGHYMGKEQFEKAEQFLTSAYKSISTNSHQAAYQNKSSKHKQRLTHLISNKIQLTIAQSHTNNDTNYLKSALDDMYRLDTIIDYVNQELLFESSVLNWRQEAKAFYNQGIEIAFTLNDKEAFWRFSEKAKSLALIEGMANDKLFLADEIINTSVQQLRELQLLEAQLKRQLNSTQEVKSIESITKELAANKNEQNTILTNRNTHFQKQIPRTINLSEIQSGLDKSTLIQYVVTENEVFAILINEDSSTLYKLSTALDIKNKIVALRSLLSEISENIDHFDEINLQLKNLNEVLIEPLSNLEDQLIIIPEDFLLLLPFESLQNNDGRYLIEDHSVQYNLSGTFYKQSKEHGKTHVYNTTILSPRYSGVIFTPLSHAQEESKLVHSLTGGHLFSDIKKDDLINRYTKSHLFHFSGHALVNQGSQNNSYLALSDTSQLTENEIYNYPNDLGLVVLSGCDTGGGEILKGEGISNLTRAFMYSGTQSVLQSLWSIDDQASQTLIKFFYQELKNGLTKGKALQQAKLNYLATVDDYLKHPYYWSAFVLVGDDAPLSFESGNSYLFTASIIGVSLLGLCLLYFKRQS